MTVQIEYLLNNEEKVQEIEAKDVATAIDIFEDAWQYAISKGYVKYLCALNFLFSFLVLNPVIFNSS